MIYIFGGGTITHVRNHFALCAPAYGGTARKLHAKLRHYPEVAKSLELTKMASYLGHMETNDDVAAHLAEILSYPETSGIVFNVALCDYGGTIGEIESGKYAQRLSSREGTTTLQLTPAPKLLQTVKQCRPDVFLVGFKTTAGATVEDQVAKAQRQIAETSADLVLANDTITRNNILISGGTAHTGTRESLLDYIAKKLAKHDAQHLA